MIQTVDILKCLSNKSRLEILEFLNERPRQSQKSNVTAIAENMMLSMSVTSRHLTRLEEIGLVIAEYHGAKTFYEIDRRNVLDFIKELQVTLG